MKLFDLHSDTLYEAYTRKLSPVSSDRLQAPLGVSPFEKTHRVSAIWCDNTLDDKACFDKFLKIKAYTEKALFKEPLPESVTLTYAVEDIRLLDRRLDRLALLYGCGVRVATLTWQGLSSVGGAFDTDKGLTDFGKAAVREASKLGIVIDLSHASEASCKDALHAMDAAGGRVIASHSNAFSVCPHRRNLTDYWIDALIERGALIGLSLVPGHLSLDKNATVDTLLFHIDHMLKRQNAESVLAFGSDFDGVSSLPEGITSLSDLPKLYEKISKAFGNGIAARMFYDNAAAFFQTPT